MPYEKHRDVFLEVRERERLICELHHWRLDAETNSSCRMSKRSMSYLQYRDKIGWFPWPFKRIWRFKNIYISPVLNILSSFFQDKVMISISLKCIYPQSLYPTGYGYSFGMLIMLLSKGQKCGSTWEHLRSLFKDLLNLTSKKLLLHWYLWMSSKIRSISLSLGCLRYGLA